MRFWTSKTGGIGIAGKNLISFAITLMISDGLGTCGMVEIALKREGIETDQMRVSGRLLKSESPKAEWSSCALGQLYRYSGYLTPELLGRGRHRGIDTCLLRGTFSRKPCVFRRRSF